MRISDWSSDVCSSDLGTPAQCSLRGGSAKEFTLAGPQKAGPMPAPGSKPDIGPRLFPSGENPEFLSASPLPFRGGARGTWELVPSYRMTLDGRSEECRVGTGCVSRSNNRWAQDTEK